VLYETVTLTLLGLKGIGPKSAGEFLSSNPIPANPSELHALLSDGAIARLGKIPDLDEVAVSWERAEGVIGQCRANGIAILGRTNPLPRLLREIPNAPLLLYVLGDQAALNEKSIAVIGTREPTEFGKKSAHKMAQVLAENKWVVVSGLAEGCDTQGHEGSLAGGGLTVAVLAHGFGRIYPAKNKLLSDRILECGGCLVTEYPPGMPPTRSSFIERDRIQSGLSLGVVVVETDIKGGTMHTVGHAKSQNRGIATIDHPPNLLNEPKTQGNQKLIQDGVATPLHNRGDLLHFVEALSSKQQLPDDKPTISQTTFDL
jgi:DNA processing protein